VLIVTL